jgi:hypothetical protein
VHDRAPKVHTTLVLVPKSICHGTEGVSFKFEKKMMEHIGRNSLNFGLSDEAVFPVLILQIY